MYIDIMQGVRSKMKIKPVVIKSNESADKYHGINGFLYINQDT